MNKMKISMKNNFHAQVGYNTGYIQYTFGYRCREFTMKDLYTFDESEAKAIETYSEICNAYDRIFHRIGVPYIKGKILWNLKY